MIVAALQLQVASAAVETEPNNSAVSANGMNLGSEIRGQLATENDQDWFSLSVPQATTVNIAFDSPQNLPSPSWEYHIVRCQDSTGASLMKFGAAQDKTFSCFLPSEGIYYFVVQKGVDALVTGQYGILITQSATPAEREPNNSRATSTPIQQGVDIRGQLSSTTDFDWYSFSAGSAGIATLSFDSPANLPSPSWEYHVIQVSDASGSVLSSVGTASDTQLNVSLPAAGTYYARVSTGRDQLLTDQYVINLLAVPVPLVSTDVAITIQTAVEIRWNSRSDRSYTIERSISMEASSWMPVTGTIPGTGMPMNYFDSTTTNSRAFYRVREQ